MLVAGRVDHKGDETVLLADAVWDWDAALGMGESAFGQAIADGDRNRRGGRGGNGYRGDTNGNGWPRTEPGGQRVAVGPGLPASAPAVRTIPHVSPLRGGGILGTIEVTGHGGAPPVALPRPRPVAPVSEMPVPGSIAGLEDGDDEPALPDEQRQAMEAIVAPDAPTLPTTARAGQVLQVRFGRTDEQRLVDAFEALRAVVNARPGETAVVLHLPGLRRQRPADAAADGGRL